MSVASLESSGNAAPIEIVGAQLDSDGVSRQDADEVLSQPSGDVAKDHVLLPAKIKLQPKHRVRQGLNNPRFNFDGFCFSHIHPYMAITTASSDQSCYRPDSPIGRSRIRTVEWQTGTHRPETDGRPAPSGTTPPRFRAQSYLWMLSGTSPVLQDIGNGQGNRILWIRAATVWERCRPSSRYPSLTVGALIRRVCFQYSLENAIALWEW